MAGLDLVCVRLLVNPPLATLLVFEVLHGVGRIDQVAVYPGRFHAGPQDPPRGPDKGVPLLVLLVAWLLADQYDRRRLGSCAEHGLGRVGEERAALATLGGALELGQRSRRRHEGLGRPWHVRHTWTVPASTRRQSVMRALADMPFRAGGDWVPPRSDFCPQRTWMIGVRDHGSQGGPPTAARGGARASTGHVPFGAGAGPFPC